MGCPKHHCSLADAEKKQRRKKTNSMTYDRSQSNLVSRKENDLKKKKKNSLKKPKG